MSTPTTEPTPVTDAQRARESLARATAVAVEAEKDPVNRDGLRELANAHVRIADVYARLDAIGAQP